MSDLNKPDCGYIFVNKDPATINVFDGRGFISAADYCREVGIDNRLAYSRFRKGVPIKEAIAPKKPSKEENPRIAEAAEAMRDSLKTYGAINKVAITCGLIGSNTQFLEHEYSKALTRIKGDVELKQFFERHFVYYAIDEESSRTNDDGIKKLRDIVSKYVAARKAEEGSAEKNADEARPLTSVCGGFFQMSLVGG